MGIGYLGVASFLQEMTEWCWAACTQMLLHYYKYLNQDALPPGKVESFFRQCEIAQIKWGVADSCSDAGMSQANKAVTEFEIAPLLLQCGLNADFHPQLLGFRAIKDEIDAGRPVLVGFESAGGFGHVAVVNGYNENPDPPDLYINDPWPGYQFASVSCEFLEDFYTLGAAKWTWINIK